MTIPILPGLSALAAAYDGYILDVWGVMHQGGDAYPDAVACVARLREEGKRVAFLSNAPRRAAQVASVLAAKGVGPELYDAVISSGEATHLALAGELEAPLNGSGRAFHLLGPAYSADLLEGLDYAPADSVASADFLLGIGLDDGRETVEAHEPVLAAAAERDLPMICVNPDRLVIRLGQPELCAGALAVRYEALGGRVRYYGKPYAEVYALSLNALDIAPERVLAVGDGLLTDIAGATAAGLDSLLVTGGLLSDTLGLVRGTAPDPEALANACRDAGAYPSAAVATFAW
jgi:HAD superfamily hydrolase (TIGR01459 family)